MTPNNTPADGRNVPEVSGREDPIEDRLSTLTRIVSDLSDKVSDLADRMDDIHDLLSERHGMNGYDPDYVPDDAEE
jgi:hypothetical protein